MELPAEGPSAWYSDTKESRRALGANSHRCWVLKEGCLKILAQDRFVPVRPQPHAPGPGDRDGDVEGLPPCAATGVATDKLHLRALEGPNIG